MQPLNCSQTGELTVNPFFKVVVCVVIPGVRVGATVARPLGSKIPERVEGYAALRNDEASFVRAIRAAAIGMCCCQKRKEREIGKGSRVGGGKWRGMSQMGIEVSFNDTSDREFFTGADWSSQRGVLERRQSRPIRWDS